MFPETSSDEVLTTNAAGSGKVRATGRADQFYARWPATWLAESLMALSGLGIQFGMMVLQPYASFGGMSARQRRRCPGLPVVVFLRRCVRSPAKMMIHQPRCSMPRRCHACWQRWCRLPSYCYRRRMSHDGPWLRHPSSTARRYGPERVAPNHGNEKL